MNKIKIRKIKTDKNSYKIDFCIELENDINCVIKTTRYNYYGIEKRYDFNIEFKSFYHKDNVILNGEYDFYESCSFRMSVPLESNDIYFQGYNLYVELFEKFDSFKEIKKFIIDLIAIEIKSVSESFDIKKKYLNHIYSLRKENGVK